MKTNFLELSEFILKNLDMLSSNLVPLWHPLGFVSCIIEDIPSSHTMRLHYWPKGERRVKNPDWPIHTHSYALTSLVLSGKLRDLQYRVVPGAELWIYSVNYFKGGSEIVRTSDTVQVHDEIDEIRSSGEQYQVPRGIFHQTQVPINQSVVTLVMLTDQNSEPPKVLGDKQSEKYPYDRIPFDSVIFWSEVRKALTSYVELNIDSNN